MRYLVEVLVSSDKVAAFLRKQAMVANGSGQYYDLDSVCLGSVSLDVANLVDAATVCNRIAKVAAMSLEFAGLEVLADL